MVAASLANLRNGSNQYKKVGPSIDGPIKASIKKAASNLSVGTSTVERAKRIQRSGSDQLAR